MSRAVRHRLFWPAVALVVLLVANQISAPSFFELRIQDGHLFGGLVDIVRNAAPLLLVSLGMTLVIATRGIDLSVGAVVAISGATAFTFVASSADPGSPVTVAIGVALAITLSLVLGLWNGFLVSVVGIQPIIATLVLMTAGRGIAMLFTGGQITTVTSEPLKGFGSGYFLGLPVPALLAGAIFGIVTVVVRRTAVGMLVESVGINPEASRLAGVRAWVVLLAVYALSGVCAGVAGLIDSANVMAADANNAGLFIELDAILAVVIGGTALSGGKFSLGGTLLGVMVLQTLEITVTILGIPPAVTPLFKAVVVIVVFLLQAPAVQARLRSRRPKPQVAAEPAVAVPA